MDSIPLRVRISCSALQIFVQLGIVVSHGNGSPEYLLAEELRGRFSLWSAYIGVYAAPRASLDARLDSHQNLRDMVLELVEMVERSLQWVKTASSLLTPGLAKSLNPSLELNPDSRSIGKASPFPECSDDEDAGDSAPGFKAVEAAIDRLLILAVEIRRGAGQSHRPRHKVKDQEAEVLCRLLLKYRYPNARNSLYSQLAASINARGSSLLYLKRHNEKLTFARHGRHYIEGTLGEETLSEGEGEETAFHSGGATVSKKLCRVAPKTDPSMLSPSVVSKIRRPKPRPSASIVSRGWTVKEANSGAASYPPMPKMGKDGKYQPCTLCGDPLEESKLTPESWEQHVDRDLEPYVCISEECRETPVFFVCPRDWLSHMQKRHTITWAEEAHTEQWYCDVEHDGPLEFEDKEAFVAHLRAEHGDKLTKSKLEGRARRNRRIAMRESFVCPFCECVPEDEGQPHTHESLGRHIAAHLKSLAFLSLGKLLGPRLTNVRLLSYGYSKGPNPTPETVGFWARLLMQLLKHSRRKDETRPLIPIAHGTGGWICMDILRRMPPVVSNPPYEEMSSSIKGIMFVGTHNMVRRAGHSNEGGPEAGSVDDWFRKDHEGFLKTILSRRHAREKVRIACLYKGECKDTTTFEGYPTQEVWGISRTSFEIPDSSYNRFKGMLRILGDWMSGLRDDPGVSGA
ncbi:hypothetical protein ACJ41O_009204 [Fusarium nematophilum]